MSESEPIREQESEKFDAVIVLGKNWQKYPPKNPSPEWRLQLSQESRLSALAAGEMYAAGMVNKIVFSTGKTAGANWPSEAKAMADYMRARFKDIPEEAVVLEEVSLDTVQNAEEVLKILDQLHITKAALLTVGFHVPRAAQIFKNFGLPMSHAFAAEDFVTERSVHHQKFVDQFVHSSGVKLEKLKELLLRGLLVIDTKGAIPSMITKKIRNPVR